ncbi:MAG: serine hydrolase [Solirubrobacteraceae bacterium]|nr:serine hydrolase [Solirubrobacteraceae bacterium]
MRRSLVVPVLVAASLSAAPASAAWTPDVRAARAYAESRPGVVSFSVRDGKRAWGSQPRRVVRTASLVKTMLLLAYLRREQIRFHPLGADQRAVLGPMIRKSDNIAATRIRNVVGNDALKRVARRAGMRDFAPAVSWGDSATTARDQAVLYQRVASLLPPRHRAYGMRLLGTIVPSQRWGIARVAPPGWRLYFKGGWGSGSGAVDHQAALLVRGDRRVTLAITTTANPSHKAGKVTLRGVAARLLRGLE